MTVAQLPGRQLLPGAEVFLLAHDLIGKPVPTFPGHALSARLRRRRVEHQREAVHAVAQAGRLGAVIEDVAEMAAATAAVHLGTDHAEGTVLRFANRVLERLIEARPAGAAFEFGV